MKSLTMSCAALAAVAAWTPVAAAERIQPPMNSFNIAYYTCDNGGAFLMSYDSTRPTSATMTTSSNSNTYALKRRPAAQGVEFADAAVRFWTDGKSVVVEGAPEPYANCQLKPN